MPAPARRPRRFGFGRATVSSESRVPSPPAKITTFILECVGAHGPGTEDRCGPPLMTETGAQASRTLSSVGGPSVVDCLQEGARSSGTGCRYGAFATPFELRPQLSAMVHQKGIFRQLPWHNRPVRRRRRSEGMLWNPIGALTHAATQLLGGNARSGCDGGSVVTPPSAAPLGEDRLHRGGQLRS